MIKKSHLIIVLLVVIIAILSMLIMANLSDRNNHNQTIHETLANNRDDPGTVEVLRHIGNPDGEKIAYVVGVHPLEHLTHETLVKLLLKMTDLNYNYDIYIINVTNDIGSYGEGYSDQNNTGRQNGQYLAYKYVYPQIAKGNYKLAIDVHSNIGAYPYKTFVFSPVKEGMATSYADDVAGMCENITYYNPESTTSGPYLTIPLNENGVPAFYYEEYSFAPQNIKDMHMMELINAVDNLEL